MEGMFSRLAWIAAVCVIISYATYLVVGNIVNAQASGINEPVVIRDELRPNTHQLSGIVVVPTPCDELSVDFKALSTTTYSLILKTWHEPSVTCGNDPVPRAFHTTVFAPAAGVYFVATLDGVALPIAVIPVINNVAH